jgi:hypothetical protein
MLLLQCCGVAHVFWDQREDSRSNLTRLVSGAFWCTMRTACGYAHRKSLLENVFSCILDLATTFDYHVFSCILDLATTFDYHVFSCILDLATTFDQHAL